MKTAGIIVLLIGLASFVSLIVMKWKGKLDKLSLKYVIISVASLAIVTSIGAFLFSYGVSLDGDKISGLGLAEMIITTLLIPIDVYFVFTALWIRKKELPLEGNEKMHKLLKTCGIVAAVLLIPLVSLYLESLTPYMTFPLPKRIIPIGDGGLTFYALFIICGAVVAYFISDDKIAKEGYPHGIFEDLLYTAFPAGIIGARIWYVIAEWNTKFAGRDFVEVFKIWDGGLAIHGGVILGAIVGVLYLRKKHKELPILKCFDIIVPTLLIAQAIGRWGNFMNAEVYGREVAMSDWSFLPTWILKQQATMAKEPGNIVIPLFLIEGIINIASYFLIVYGVGKGLKKYIVPGDIGGLYFVAYGIIRFFLEPLRNEAFIMGGHEQEVFTSQAMSAGFLVFGILVIVVLHVLDYKNKKKAKEVVEVASENNETK